MKKFFAALCLLLMCGAAHTEEAYDPLHTLLALNMARASIIKIIVTKDKMVLEQEYQNIITKLRFGNIASDEDMTKLYNYWKTTIERKNLRDEEVEQTNASYNGEEEGLLLDTVNDIITSDKSLMGFLENLAVSCVSSYFEYDNAKSELAERLSDELWQLKKEEIKDFDTLQQRMLSSSWELVRNGKYNEYLKKYFREHFGSYQHMVLSMEELQNFYGALALKDKKSRIDALRRYEYPLYAYPPYWCYRAKTAQELHNDEEAKSCFENFNKVWRPVLTRDPYKVEELQFRIAEILKREKPTNEAKHEAFKLLEEMMRYVPTQDWANDIFAGTAYFSLGSRDKGIEIVAAHPDVEICKTLLNDFMLKDALVNTLRATRQKQKRFSKV